MIASYSPCLRQVTSSQDPDKKYFDFEEVPKKKEERLPQ